ncbi:MAG: hypothetical protein K0Q55_3832 [Verrucomicrobia bacterium]|nr:hypothetical protein [Verrucomicrobiota bacterium]
MTAMRTVAQEQVAKSIQSIGIRRVSVQWSFASVLTDSPESQKGDLAGGSCLAQCVVLETHCCASATCPPEALLASRPRQVRRSSYREDAGRRPGG